MRAYSVEAKVTHIYHLSSHDGRGVRTTFFLKGCPLRCVWCHNPETINIREEVLWQRELCIGCGSCMAQCGTGALKLGDNINFINRDLCQVCGKCVGVCPSKALKLSAQRYSYGDIVDVIRKDAPLFKSMNGGVTFSGGEPALHADFILKVIDECDDSSIHYALDTCGHAPRSSYEKLLPRVNQILFDIKEIDPQRHKAFTSQDNSLILSNLQYICSEIKRQCLDTKIWIRTPLIPGYNGCVQSVTAIAKFVATLPSDIVERWEMCCFNNLCVNKYRQLGVEWCLKDAELLTKAAAKGMLDAAKEAAPSVDIRLTGLTKREE